MSLSRTNSTALTGTSATANGDAVRTRSDTPDELQKKPERHAQQTVDAGVDEKEADNCIGFDDNDPENPHVRQADVQIPAPSR